MKRQDSNVENHLLIEPNIKDINLSEHETDEFEDIKISGDDELIIWGVVTSVIHQYE